MIIKSVRIRRARQSSCDGKICKQLSFEELRLEESKILKRVEGAILPVQGTERCQAAVKTTSIPSAEETRNCVKNCAIISFQTTTLFRAVGYFNTFCTII
jgi:hypothetical protein